MPEASGRSHPLEALRGKKILSAMSSLRNFSIEFESNLGLCIDAVMDEGEPGLRFTVIEASRLPKAPDAVCAVDWSWIYQTALKHASSSSASLRLELEPSGPLLVSAGTWQGQPFLSFQPYKAEARKPS